MKRARLDVGYGKDDCQQECSAGVGTTFSHFLH